MKRAIIKSCLILNDGTVNVYDSIEEFEHGFLVRKDGYYGFCKLDGEVLVELKTRKKIIPCGHTLFVPSYTGYYDSVDLWINYTTKNAFETVTVDDHFIYARDMNGRVTRFIRSNGAMVIDT